MMSNHSRALPREPTSMRVIKAHKSMNVLRVTFGGVAAHSSLTSEGVNAVEYAARLITYLRDRADEWRTQGPFDDAFFQLRSSRSRSAGFMRGRQRSPSRQLAAASFCPSQ